VADGPSGLSLTPTQETKLRRHPLPPFVIMDIPNTEDMVEDNYFIYF
jgi:hypothetical protein